MALGAQRFDILRMAMSEGMRVVVIGLACGLVGAAILTRLFRSMLFNVAPADPLTFLCVSAILAGVALLACISPRSARLGSIPWWRCVKNRLRHTSH